MTSLRERLRNRLKGQPNHAPRGNSVPWKKDSDPAVASDAIIFFVLLDVLKWTFVSSWWRVLCPLLFPRTTRCFYDVTENPGVRGFFALTIDDCFCRQDDEDCSLVQPLLALLGRHGAKVTFFVTLQYSHGPWRTRQILQAVGDGHELGNHGEEDREYDQDSAVSFERAIVATDDFIQRLHASEGPPSRARSSSSARRASSPARRRLASATPEATRRVKWFRAPSASLSKTMDSVLSRLGFTHVLTDAYANDPHVPWPRWIAWAMCRHATHGSILVVHMPERGFREWALHAIDPSHRPLGHVACPPHPTSVGDTWQVGH